MRGKGVARRGSPYDMQRMAARARRVRAPRDAGLVRRALWSLWRLISSAARPALFTGLLIAAGAAAMAGLQQLGPGPALSDPAMRLARAFESLAPDAQGAAGLWAEAMDSAMRPRLSGPPDIELAVSLAHAFEDMAGRERFASLAWARSHAMPHERAEASLRAMPVWIRARELELVWQRAYRGQSLPSLNPPALALAPERARARMMRAQDLYGGVDAVAAGFFSGQSPGAINLATLPGLALEGEVWLPADAQACAGGDALSCRLAGLGGREGAGAGARIMRAALMTGHAGEAFTAELDAMEADKLAPVMREIGAVARNTSPASAIRLLAHVEAPQDVVRLSRVSAMAGARTLALFHFHGRDALALARVVDEEPVMTRAAAEYFIVSGLMVLLAFGMVLAAIVSASRVASSRRAGLGQRLDIAARELLLGRKV